MASTPSASALSAVLRCQGNILARKQATKKRPPASVYAGLGMTCGDSVKFYFRSLWGFIFHGERVEIPGVLSVTVRFKNDCSGKCGESKDHLVKNSPKAGSKLLTRKILSEPHQWPNSKLTSDNYFAFKSQHSRVLSKNNLVLRLDGTYLRKLNSDYPWTCCICVVCAQRRSTLKYNNVNPFSLGLLWIFKNKLIYFTTAVADSVRTQVGIGWNQLHPDCDKSGCIKCTSEHHEDKPKTLEGAEPGE